MKIVERMGVQNQSTDVILDFKVDASLIQLCSDKSFSL